MQSKALPVHLLETPECLHKFLLYFERKKNTSDLVPPRNLRVKPTVVILHNVYTDLFRWTPEGGISREPFPPEALVAMAFGVHVRKPQLKDRVYWSQRILSYFKARNPGQANAKAVESVLQKFDKDNVPYEKMWTSLLEKYGPEPPIAPSQERIKEVTEEGVTGEMTHPSGTGAKQHIGPPVAYFIERRLANPLTSTVQFLAAHYLPQKHITNYFRIGHMTDDDILNPEHLGSPPDRSGLLQVVVQSARGQPASTFRIVWSDGGDVISVKERRNALGYTAPRAVPYERCVTFDGPSHLSSVCENVDGKVEQELRELVREIAVYLQRVERRTLTHLTLYFKYDEAGLPWFQWCHKVRFEGSLARGSELYDLKFRHPIQFRGRTHLQPKYATVHEEDLIDHPTVDVAITDDDPPTRARKRKEQYERARTANSVLNRYDLKQVLDNIDTTKDNSASLTSMYSKSMSATLTQFPDQPPAYEPSRQSLIKQQREQLERRKNPPKKPVPLVENNAHFLTATSVYEKRRAIGLSHRKEMERLSGAKKLLDCLDGTQKFGPRLIEYFSLKNSEVKLLRTKTTLEKPAQEEPSARPEMTFSGNSMSCLFPPPDDPLNTTLQSKSTERHQQAKSSTKTAKAYSTQKKLMESFAKRLRTTMHSSTRDQRVEISKVLSESAEEQRQLRLMIEASAVEHEVWREILEKTHDLMDDGARGETPLPDLDNDDGEVAFSDQDGTHNSALYADGAIPLSVLMQPSRIDGLDDFFSMKDRHKELAQLVELIEDFFEGLQYHVFQHFQRERALKRVHRMPETTPSAPFVVSLPPGVANLERMMEEFIRSIPYVVQLNNNQQPLARMKELIQKQINSESSAMEDIFTWHLRVDPEDDSSLRAVATFAFMKEPNRTDLAQKIHNWNMKVLRNYVKSELCEIQEEVHAGRAASVSVMTNSMNMAGRNPLSTEEGPTTGEEGDDDTRSPSSPSDISSK